MYVVQVLTLVLVVTRVLLHVFGVRVCVGIAVVYATVLLDMVLVLMRVLSFVLACMLMSTLMLMFGVGVGGYVDVTVDAYACP